MEKERKAIDVEAGSRQLKEESNSRDMVLHILFNASGPLLMLSFGSVSPFIIGPLTLLLVVLATYFTKNTFSWSLVGIKYYIDKNQQPTFPHIIYSSRPLPFVATLSNSNAFWLTLFFSNVIFILLLFSSLFSSNYSKMLFIFVIEFVNAANLQLLVVCHGRTKTASDAVARNLLLDPHVEFQSVIVEESSDDFNPNLPQVQEPEKLVTSGGLAIPEKFLGKVQAKTPPKEPVEEQKSVVVVTQNEIEKIEQKPVTVAPPKVEQPVEKVEEKPVPVEEPKEEKVPEKVEIPEEKFSFPSFNDEENVKDEKPKEEEQKPAFPEADFSGFNTNAFDNSGFNTSAFDNAPPAASFGNSDTFSPFGGDVFAKFSTEKVPEAPASFGADFGIVDDDNIQNDDDEENEEDNEDDLPSIDSF